jgi:hypothetical protein
MGIANPDHVVTHEAGMLVRSALGDETSPGMLAWRVSKLFRAGIWPTPAIVPVKLDARRKTKAIMLYTSQIPPLEQDHMLRERIDGNVPEQYWRLAAPPVGWGDYFDMD